MSSTYIKVLILLLTIFSSSCISLRPNVTNKFTLNPENLQQINGFYSNVSENKIDIQHTSLWKQLNYIKKDTLVDWRNHKIELEFVSKKRIIAKLWKGDSILSRKILKGKIKDGLFSVRRKVKVIGVPFIYFFTSDNKFEIGLSVDHNLILNRATNRYGMIFIMSAGNSQQFTSIYQRKVRVKD